MTIHRSPAVFPARTAVGYEVLAIEDEEGDYTFYSSTRLIVNAARLVSGYVGLSPERYNIPFEHNALRLAAVTTLRIEGEFRPFPNGLPLIRLVTDAVVSSDPVSAIQEVDIARTAVVDRPVELVETAG